MGSAHAIVIGGSMAGLCAARVLARFYNKVTVIDRDAYPAGAHEQPGVPQSRHVHALLMRRTARAGPAVFGFREDDA
jgi:2-polyprenyl-6-methoxyphenol hydroxylase-like FAD-dependent oxidoreductase